MFSVGAVRGSPLPYCMPPVNAFTAGIGGAAVAVTDDPSAIYWNPAAFAASELMQVDFTVATPKLEMPASWSFLVANSSVKGGGRFGLGAIRRSAEKPNGEKFRSFQVNIPISHAFSAGIVPVGVGLKFISENYGNAGWKSGMAVDAGAMLVLPTGFKIGYAVHNLIGSDLRAFPSMSWLGLSWGGGEFPILVAGQVRAERLRHRTYTTNNFNIGAEIAPVPSIPKIRIGWLRAKGEGRMTTGVSYKFKKENARLEYSLIVNPDDWNKTGHFITYSWGLKPPESVKGRRAGGWR